MVTFMLKGKQLKENGGQPAAVRLWEPLGKDPGPEPPFTTTLSAIGTAPGVQTRTCMSAAVSCVCMCIYLHHFTGFCQGTLDYPVLREPSPREAWVISLWLLPVTASPHITAHTHIVQTGNGRYSLHVLPRQCEVTQFSISKETGSPLSQPRPCGSNQSCVIFQSSAP